MMSSWRLVWKSLLHHWRLNLAVALGVMAATAVLVGALLVGDSVRASLLNLTLDRLGRIDEVLITDRFFREQLASELAGQQGFRKFFDRAVPAIVFASATVERPGDIVQRASHVLVVGSDPEFWELGTSPAPAELPHGEQILLNQSLANDLGAKVGDSVVLRLPNVAGISADSAFGNQDDLVRSFPELTVVGIVPTKGLGQFSLHPRQTIPRNAFVSKELLQEGLEQRAKVNAILVSGKSDRQGTSAEASDELARSLRPTLEDFGFQLERVRRTFSPSGSDEEDVVFDYFHLTTDRMIFPPSAQQAVENALAADRDQPVLTYLANTIAKQGDQGGESGGRIDGIPYSLVTAIDSTSRLGPLVDNQGTLVDSLGDDEIVLNSWARNQLNAKIGDSITISYFEPETMHGSEQERTKDFKLKAVVSITEPSRPYFRDRDATFSERPTLANDPQLTPEVKGFTDSDTISDADPPFRFDASRIEEPDDEYWSNYRTTPKAFVSLHAGQELWGSRFGRVTSYRIPAPAELPVAGAEEAEFVERLERKLLDQFARDSVTLGLQFRSVKREQIEASSGATPFDVLFLSLSFFIIAAALMLVALLFRLGVEQRASELGILLSVGIRRGLASRCLIGEGVIVAALGGLLGVVAGVAYAWLMLAGLRSWWVGAIVTPFLEFHWTWTSLAIGYVAGVIICAVTIAMNVRRLRRIEACRLLAGQVIEQISRGQNSQRRGVWTITIAGLFLAAIVLAALATQLGGEAQAGSFVGAGVLLLTALLLLIWRRLTRGDSRTTTQSFAITGLALSNAARNPSRSTMTIGLIASASFLIVAMSSFRLIPTDEGKGGFDLIAESTTPVYADLSTPEGREEALAEQANLLEGGTILSLRLKDGEDASCNNLYQARRPRVLGVPQTMIEHFDEPNVQQFGWAGSAAETESEEANPWRLLEKPIAENPDIVPVVIDKNTAMYSLKLYLGMGQEYSITYEDGRTIDFQVVGLLSNSILQGSLLIGESYFKKHYSDVEGYRQFLIKAPLVTDQQVQQAANEDPSASAADSSRLRDRLAATRVEQVRLALEDRLGDEGFDAVSTDRLLEQLLAVQNTYLSTFQSLGALGLLLGTFGLATVQLRSVLERRKELALLRAIGYRRRRLAELVMLENSVLLLGGLATGVIAALLAVLPHMLLGSASVPLGGLVGMLALILVIGFVSGLVAVRATLSCPLISALRNN